MAGDSVVFQKQRLSSVTMAFLLSAIAILALIVSYQIHVPQRFSCLHLVPAIPMVLIFSFCNGRIPLFFKSSKKAGRSRTNSGTSFLRKVPDGDGESGHSGILPAEYGILSYSVSSNNYPSIYLVARKQLPGSQILYRLLVSFTEISPFLITFFQNMKK